MNVETEARVNVETEARVNSERALGEFVVALADGLVAGGVRHVCLCPGSRSTPIAIAVHRHPALQTWIHLDERSCAYFALGLAKVRREPVAIVCTSGTAALNFAPAVAEAALSGLPLVVLTADRPAELRGVGANQTVDQVNLFGSHAKSFAELPVPAPGASSAAVARHWGQRAPVLALAGPAGPVHLNLPFREPLIPQLPDPPAADRAATAPQRPGPPPRREPSPGDIAALAPLLASHPRGIIVAGPSHAPESSQAITGLAALLGYPILADPLSQLRRGPHDRSHVIDSYDAFLRGPIVPALQPDVVLRTGATPTSKALGRFLAGLADAEQIVVAPPGRWNDPDLRATRSLDADPVAVFRRLIDALASDFRSGASRSGASPAAGPPLTGPRPDPGWLDVWRRRDQIAAAALDAAFDAGAAADALSEPGAIRELIDALPADATLVAGNSLPIRDVESVLRGADGPLHVFANRGASGIDGVVSTALGIAAGRSQAPLALVIGDLSLYHDMNGLIAAGRFGLDATIVVLNNDGGGIFSLLPQAQRVPEFETLFGTPHGLDFEHAAAQYGLGYARPQSRDAYRAALDDSLARPGVQLIELRSDRAANAALHRDAWDRVREALG